MKSHHFLALRGFRTRRKQQLLSLISIVLSVLLFGTAAALLLALQRPFDQMLQRQSGSHLFLLFDSRDHDPSALQEWFCRQPEVAGVGDPAPYYLHPGPIVAPTGEIDKMVQLTEWQPGNRTQDRIQVLQGKAAERPGPGEIWLPKAFADKHGLTAGDTIGLPVAAGVHSLRIGALVLDPHYVSGIINPQRAWLAPGALPYFVSMSDLNQVTLGVRLHAVPALDALWSRFVRTHAFSGRRMDYHLFKGVFLSFYQIIGAALLLFAALGILASLFLIGAGISSAIHEDYRRLGMLLAIGLTPREIRSSILIQYGVLGLLALPLGLAGAYGTTGLLLSSTLRSVGALHFQLSWSLPFALTASVFFFFIGAVIRRHAGQATRIPPARAIRFGAAGAQKKEARHDWWRRAPGLNASGRLGLQFLFADPRRALQTALTGGFTVLLLVFAVNLSHSFSRMKAYQPMWGFDRSDLQVQLRSQILLPLTYEQFMEHLDREAQVAFVAPYRYAEAKVLDEDGRVADDLIGKIYDSDLDGAGLVNLQGRHPEAAGAVSLCIGTARRFEKAPGDSIHLFLEGVARRYSVSGIYQDISNMGKGFRMHARTLQSVNPLAEPDRFGIRLSDGVTTEAFKAALERQFGETISVEGSIDEQLETMGIVANMRRSMLLFAAFFLLVLALAVFNDILLFSRSHRTQLGILKTLGYTPGQLRAALSVRTLLLMAASIPPGLLLGRWLSPLLLNQVGSGIGLPEFPFFFSAGGTLAVIPLVLACGAAGAWLAARPASRQSSNTLIQNL